MKKGVHLQPKLHNTRTPSVAHNSPVACVIPQQFSSASFFSMCFHTNKKKNPHNL